MKKQYLYFLIAAVFIGATLYGFIGDDGRAQLQSMVPFRRSVATETATVRFNDVTVAADVASTPSQLSRGLSGRDSLSADRGMLFILGQDSTAAFWMKDMKFPIDIIWIHDDTVVDIDADVPVASGTPPLYTPVSPVNYVVEVNAGFAETHHIAIGSSVAIIVDPVRKPY